MSKIGGVSPTPDRGKSGPVEPNQEPKGLSGKKPGITPGQAGQFHKIFSEALGQENRTD